MVDKLAANTGNRPTAADRRQGATAAAGGAYRLEASADRMLLKLTIYAASEDERERAAIAASIEAEAMRLGIVAPLRGIGIRSALLQPMRETVIAQGMPPIPGIAATVEPEGDRPGRHSPGRYGAVRSVLPGQPFARVTTGTPSLPGRDLFGNDVPVPEPPRLHVIPSPRVKLEADGRLVALAAGQPIWGGDGNVYVDIVETYVIEGDADPADGMLAFRGNVLVTGNVLDGMRIEATGDIAVDGHVYRAALRAGGSVRVGGHVISGLVQSGGAGQLFRQLAERAAAMYPAAAGLTQSVELIRRRTAAVGKTVSEAQVIGYLLETHYRHLPAQVREWTALAADDRLAGHEGVLALKEAAMRLLNPVLHYDRLTLGSLQEFERLTHAFLVEAETRTDRSGDLRLRSAQHAELEAHGSIRIDSEGVICCTAKATADIVFASADAVCNGSKLEAGGRITASVVGGRTIRPSVLSAGIAVSAVRLYEGKIKAGNRTRIVLSPESPFRLEA